MSRPIRQTAGGRAYLDLQNRARRERRSTHELLILYVLERWLTRLAASSSASTFVLKGGMLLAAFDARRPTADADLLARHLANDEHTVAARVQEITQIVLAEDDGVEYLSGTISTQATREEDPYAGMRIGMDCQDLSSPHTYSWVQSSNSGRAVLDYLTVTGADNITRPALVERWEPSPDLKTWTLHLRRDVKWRKGRQFTADDVVWNLKHVLDPKVGSSTVGLMKGFILDEFETDEVDAKGNKKKSVRLWDVATAKEIRTLKGHQGAINCVAYSPDGKMLASGSFDKTMRLWNAATGKEICTVKGHTDMVRCLSFSPDGRSMATGSFDKTIKLWEIAK